MFVCDLVLFSCFVVLLVGGFSLVCCFGWTYYAFVCLLELVFVISFRIVCFAIDWWVIVSVYLLFGGSLL